MATETRNRREGAGTNAPVTRRTSGGSASRRSETNQYSSGPFGLMRQMQDQMDRWFSRFGLGGDWSAPFTSMSRIGEPSGDWMPAIEAFQRGNEFIIRADVPGMTRNELSVEMGDDAVTIRGERKREERHEEDGMFWSERSYGRFCRVVPLPPGAIPDSAKATFNNGVLEVVIPAPSQEARRGRKIDISGRDETK